MKVDILEEAMREIFDPTVKVTPKIQSKRETFLLKLPLFSLIYQKKGDSNFQLIIHHIRMVKSDFGQIIFKDESERCFNYILRGTAMMFVKSQGEDKRGQPKFHRRLGPGQHFGEKMLLGKEQIESVRTVSCCYLLQLSMEVFYNAFSGHFKYEQLRDKINFLKEIWIFTKVRRPIIERILLSSHSYVFKKNHTLFREGEAPDSLWVIMEGEVTLMTKREGKLQAFCVFGRRQICGIVEIMQETVYNYSVVCTSDYTTVLRVQKQIMLQVVCKEIEPGVIRRQKQLTNELRKSRLSTEKLQIVANKENESEEKLNKRHQLYLMRRKHKSQNSMEQPLDKMQVLNSLFNRQVQLKQQKIRGIRLSFIKEAQETLYNTNRMSFLNSSCTFDKEIIVKYLGRKERQYQKAVRKQKQFQIQKVILVPELKVERSSAVKNHKRKLKNSRRHCFSSLDQI